MTRQRRSDGQSNCSLIIAGSRSLSSLWLPDDGSVVVRRCIAGSSRFELEAVAEVVSGTARGPDTWGERFAQSQSGVELTRMPADWDTHGKRAGPIRNTEMAEYADGLLAIYDGQSAGTQDMIDTAVDRDMPVTVIRMDREGIKRAVLRGETQ